MGRRGRGEGVGEDEREGRRGEGRTERREECIGGNEGKGVGETGKEREGGREREKADIRNTFTCSVSATPVHILSGCDITHPPAQLTSDLSFTQAPPPIGRRLIINPLEAGAEWRLHSVFAQCDRS